MKRNFRKCDESKMIYFTKSPKLQLFSSEKKLQVLVGGTIYLDLRSKQLKSSSSSTPNMQLKLQAPVFTADLMKVTYPSEFYPFLREIVYTTCEIKQTVYVIRANIVVLRLWITYASGMGSNYFKMTLS